MSRLSRRIRVLVVDDSPTARRILRTHLERDPRFEIVGEGSNGREALELVTRLDPDVVSLDLNMPVLDGRAFLRARGPRGVPVVAVSSELTQGSKALAEIEALGAQGCVAKCQVASHDCMRDMLSDLTRALLKAAVASGRVTREASPHRRPLPTLVPNSAPAEPVGAPAVSADGILAIGSSTGGVEALGQVLLRLPPDCPPVVVSQHMPPGFTSSMAQRFDEICRVHVAEATDGALLRRGVVLVAPGNQHLRVVRSGSLRVLLGEDAKVNGHRPSVCVMFRSIAKLGLPGVRAALLTGMGRDGAAGMLELRHTGAFTIAQDEASCVVWGMPKAAVEIGAAAAVLSIEQIAEGLMNPKGVRGRALVRA